MTKNLEMKEPKIYTKEFYEDSVAIFDLVEGDVDVVVRAFLSNHVGYFLQELRRWYPEEIRSLEPRDSDGYTINNRVNVWYRPIGTNIFYGSYLIDLTMAQITVQASGHFPRWLKEYGIIERSGVSGALIEL